MRVFVYRPALVGRDHWLRELGECVARGRRGSGTFVLIGGESGIGKTSLAVELAAREGYDLQVLTCACRPTAELPAHLARDVEGVEGAPLAAFGELLLAIANRCRDADERVEDEAHRLLGAHGRVLAAIRSDLLLLPGLDSYPELPELPSDGQRDRLFSSLRDVIAAYVDEQPLFLLLDDLHWSDKLTLQFLATLTPDWLRGKHLVIVATYRTEEDVPALKTLCDHAQQHPQCMRVLELGRLDPANIRTLVQDMLAVDHPSETLVAWLTQESEGNPFFVAEYLRMATAEGLLRRRASPQGAGQLDETRLFARASRLPLPHNLHDLIMRRLECLSTAARRLVAIGSILGREFGSELLWATLREADATEMTEAEVMEAVRQLLGRQILERVTGDEVGDEPLRFMHDKLKETAYTRIAPERRITLHRAAATVIETRYRDTPVFPAFHPALANHWSVAGEPARAIEYLEKAADRSLAHAAYGQAEEFFRRACTLVATLPPLLRPDARRQAHWEHGIAKAGLGLGDLAAVESHALRALEHYGQRLPQSRGGWALFLAKQVGRQALHLAGLKRLPPLAESPPVAWAEAVMAAALLGQRYLYADDALAMFTASLLTVNLAEEASLTDRVPHSYSALGLLAGMLRLHRLAAGYFGRARASTSALKEPSEYAFVLAVESFYYGNFGRWPAARAAALRAEEVLGQTHDPHTHELVQTTLGHVEYFTGHLVAALARYEEVLRSARVRACHQHATWGLFSKARSLAALGRFKEALPLLEEACLNLASRPELQSEIICLGLLGLCWLRMGRSDLARQFADQTLARIRRSYPTGYAVIEGYRAAAEVYRELWTRAGSSTEAALLAERARDLTRAFDRFVQLFPIGLPMALTHTGEVAEVEGRPQRARRYLERALRYAQAFGMPRDEAMAHLSLYRVLTPSPLCRGHLDQARALFIRLGCAFELGQLEELGRSERMPPPRKPA